MKKASAILANTNVVVVTSIFTSIHWSVAAAENQQTIKLGALPVNQPVTMAKRFSPSIAYLKEVGKKSEKNRHFSIKPSHRLVSVATELGIRCAR